ncbi:hypothetical protein GobsT_14330 [Gemmata obscuriglobus]|uniref:Uncharacterized protein n=1 Tax=Gemmata obscuriglobus TaxID=114 RepID=A0A2Z3H945_9BACT|nr:hypothetical protein [Gemmata obscuriglobus]AWM40136.1 hypothetical protein C1280_26115 [Gemmata obscuriglobus]QEG26688.1 hypothetical protein GobsT_14330 [Gemmata obscuriglobus]VTS02353.1 Uncharacterized protein OS=Singulisphaera acidiphila (strain ATCC BAA-1392 / DSM 18658 / VKM B-2454 / MOB10) GN=Sinac_7662 PE=4 SV=1 [Gemmata obscuriglobus UQM 2246]
MSSGKQSHWLSTAFGGALLAAMLGMAVGVYLEFFTPQKRQVRACLREADEKCEAAIEPRLRSVSEVLAKGRKGAKPFAEDALSMRGKWNALVGLFDGRSHKEYVTDAFTRHVFSSDELRAAIEGAVRGYLLDIEGIEAEMLVRLRADLATGGAGLPHLGTDEAFAQEYQRLLTAVATDLQTDLGLDVARLVAGEVVSRVASQALTAAATQMGISLTVMGSSTAATLGVGAVVGIIADYIVGLVLEALGYDAAGEVQNRVEASLNKVQTALLQEHSFLPWEKTGTLRVRLQQLHESRSQVRRAAVYEYLKGGDK